MNLIRDMPGMLNKIFRLRRHAATTLSDVNGCGHAIDAMADNMCARTLGMGDSVVKYSLASLVRAVDAGGLSGSGASDLVFFLVKDKEQMLNAVRRVLPRNRGLAGQVWKEMNQQITNYIRGKVLEMVVVGVATLVRFSALWP